MICWQDGYQLNQVLFTKIYWSLQMIYPSRVAWWYCESSCPCTPVYTWEWHDLLSPETAISNQPIAGSIKVRHIKSNTVTSCPLRMYGPTRSRHSVSQGFWITSLAGSLPFLWLCCLLAWYFLLFLTYDQVILYIPFHYNAMQRVSFGCCMRVLQKVVLPISWPMMNSVKVIQLS